jgi:hypothetical protein
MAQERADGIIRKPRVRDRTLRITRNQDSIAEFQSEYYQYWEYVEETSAGTGEDTQTDPSVSG